jgi:hypothetical protein
MNNLFLQIKKWSIRAFIAVGALLGLSACHSNKNVVTTTTDPGYYPGGGGPEIHKTVYGPPTDPIVIKKDEPKPEKVVYGPPVN